MSVLLSESEKTPTAELKIKMGARQRRRAARKKGAKTRPHDYFASRGLFFTPEFQRTPCNKEEFVLQFS